MLNKFERYTSLALVRTQYIMGIDELLVIPFKIQKLKKSCATKCYALLKNIKILNFANKVKRARRQRRTKMGEWKKSEALWSKTIKRCFKENFTHQYCISYRGEKVPTLGMYSTQ